MIRLTLFGILLFSGLYFMTGQNSVSQPGHVSMASFDDSDLSSFIDEPATGKSQINLGKLNSSVDGLRSSIGVTWGSIKKNIRYYTTAANIFPEKKTVKPDTPVKTALAVIPSSGQNPAPATKAALANTVKAIPTPAQAVVKNKKWAIPLPVARPDPLAIKLAKKAREAEGAGLTSDKSKKSFFLAAFGRFKPTKETTTQDEKENSTTTKPPRTRTISSFANSARARKRARKHQDPRFLTVLIKREMRRLDCYSGAAGTSWNTRIRERIAAIKAPLTSSGPTLKTLAFLESKTSLVCPTANKPGLDLAARQKNDRLKANVIKKYSIFNANRTARIAELPATGNISKKIEIRDRSGQLVTGSSPGKTATVTPGSNTGFDKDAMQVNSSGYASLENNSPYRDRNGIQQRSMRPPAYTVGRNEDLETLDHPSQTASKRPVKKYKKPKKRAKWMSNAFGE